MGGLLTSPVTSKKSDQGEGLGIRYGLSSMQGWRPEMEDTHDVKLGLKYGLNDWSFFAVFDGHAGKCAAAFAAWNLLDYILKDREFKLDTELEPQKEAESTNIDDKSNGNKLTTPQENSTEDIIDTKRHPSNTSTLSDNLSKSNIEENHQLQQLSENADTATDKIDETKPKFASYPILKQLEMVYNAIKSGFLKLDQSMRTGAQDMSGCTAVCTLISPTHLFIANCGDSRAVLFDGTKPRFATEDHKPFNPKERKRIIDAGGTATQRINGTLAVSRALGDFEFKKDTLRGPCEQLVSPEPEVTVIERHQTDEFIILACDGIWDVMNNEDLCLFVRHSLRIEASLEKICSSVLDVCLRKGSRDNMSIIIVVFEPGPTVQQEALLLEKKNDEELLELADAFQDEDTSDDFSTFISSFGNCLGQTNPILPPGAGIEAKYDLLRKRFEENLKKYGEQEIE